MNHRRLLLGIVRVSAGLAGSWALAGSAAAGPAAGPHSHDHPPVPAPYANAYLPVHVWTDPASIARGREIYVERCLACHGERGDGQGPVAASLPLRPADVTDARMVAEMTGNYWLWRVSEGGQVEPFRSQGSTMPALKGVLSVQDRWAVIAYMHTLSGHTGRHVASEHPELAAARRSVTGEGTVIALNPGKQQLVVQHGDLEGFMEAMTMGYTAAPPSLLERVKPGDRIRFTIDTAARAIIRIEKLQD